MIKRFGSLNLYLSYDDKTYGRTIANSSFLKALSRYGTFDEYHFYYGELPEKHLFLEQ